MSKTVPVLIAIAAALTSVAGCGNAVDAEPPLGLTGISVTTAGELVVEVFVCRDEVDTIAIVRDREGLEETEANPVVRTYTSSTPSTGHLTLNLARPATGWSPRTPTALEPGKGYVVTGEGGKGHDGETVQLNLDADDLAALEPGGIYTSDDELSTELTRHTSAELERNAEKSCG